ncbi:hypothetical protein D3C72_2592630 [compost metagenome]
MGRPLLSSVSDMITPIRMAVMITSTRNAWAVDRLGLGKVENTDASSRLAAVPRTIW